MRRRISTQPTVTAQIDCSEESYQEVLGSSDVGLLVRVRIKYVKNGGQERLQ